MKKLKRAPGAGRKPQGEFSGKAAKPDDANYLRDPKRA